MTVYWVIWDAAAQWIVDRLDRSGSLPALRRLRADGVTAAGRPPRPNCQTPPSLATLFTGTSQQEHGVTGFTVPGGPADPVGTHRSGFGLEYPGRPPVWRSAQEHGLRTAFVHAPWIFAADGTVADGVQAAVEAYSNHVAGSGLLSVTGEAEQQWDAGDHAVRVVRTDSGVRVVTALGRHDVSDNGCWSAVRLAAATGFWVRLLKLPAGLTLARTGTWTQRAAGANGELVGRLAEGEVFAGEGLKSIYRDGRLGPKLIDGGSGRAEEIFISSLECIARSFGAAADAVLASAEADLVVIYLPLTDDIGHELVGWCDPASAAFRPEAAEAIWAQVTRGYRLVDDVLGRVLDRAGPEDTVILGADHGIVGSSQLVWLNQALIDAGCAALGPDGTLDLPRSSVVYHPANNGSLRVNHAGLPGGLVPRSDSGTALRAALAVLAAIVDPVSGMPVVAGFISPAGEVLPLEDIGDQDDVAYVVLHDDYQPTADVVAGPVVRPMLKSAAHVVNTGSDRLQATFAARGPGLVAGAHLGVVDNTAGAHLVLRRLGLELNEARPWPPL